MKRGIVWMILICLFSGLDCRAQEILHGEGFIKNAKIERLANKVLISMQVIFRPELRVNPSGRIVLQPELKSAGQTLKLPPVEMTGRRRKIQDERNSVSSTLHTKYIVRQKKSEQTTRYETTVPYEQWMNQAVINIREELCGCNNTLVSASNQLLKQVEFHPLFAYLPPGKELQKTRHKSGSAMLGFVVNTTTIRPDFQNNQNELDKIRSTIESIKNDPDVQISQISVQGFASPEGPYDQNKRLAQGRTEAVKANVCQLHPFPDQLFSLDWVAEDWEGLVRLIEESDLPEKEKILDIIRTTDILKGREKELMLLKEGNPWRYMQEHFFPQLRRADYKITYTIRGFEPEEARKTILTHPEKLSAGECWQIALEYPQESPEFKEIIRICQKTFPDHPVTNFNRGILLMHEGHYEEALPYLEKAGKFPEAFNALGVCAMITKDYTTARQYLKKAESLGVTAATHNLNELGKVDEK